MKSLKLKPGKLPSSVSLPGSKSYANRALIIAAKKSGAFTIHDLPESTDVTILVECLREIGLKISRNESTCLIDGSFPQCEKDDGCSIFVGEGGTTARFLACFVLLGKQNYTLVLGDRLKQRPWNEFIEQVNGLGAYAELDGNCLRLRGPLVLPETIEVDCSRTTQFATGFQLAFGDLVKVLPRNLNSSQSYWKMTELIQSSISSASSYFVPLDWSSASYPMAFAAINQEIGFPGLKVDSFQADSKFANILRDYNCLEENSAGILVKPSATHKNAVIDVSDSLDLVPALSFFFAHIEGQHCLKNIQNLVHKESDRLDEVIKLLKQFSRMAERRGDDLWITGSNEKIQVSEDLVFPDDHRMVMTGALFLLHHSGGSLSPAEAVNKSYPRFFELLEGYIAP